MIRMKRQERQELVRKNKTNQEIKKLADAYGYCASEGYICTYGKPELSIRPKDRSHRSFYPCLYMRGHWDIADQTYIVEGWEIETVSYGSLDPEEYEVMMERMHCGLNLAKALKMFDLNTLEKLPNSFDDDEDSEAQFYFFIAIRMDNLIKLGKRTIVGAECEW